METLALAPACRHSRIRVETLPDRVQRPSDRIDASVSATGIRDGLFEVRAKKVRADVPSGDNVVELGSARRA